MKDKFDVVIIGGGPSGASTALYAARGGLSVCVLHNDSSALHKAHKIENYYGAGAVSGKQLYERGLEQIAAVGAEVVCDEATFCQYDGAAFSVSTVKHGVLTAKRLVIATGAARARADIGGIAEFEGKGVSYCAVCDAFFYRKKRVGVVGAGEFAAHEYSALEKLAAETHLLTDGEKASFAVPNTRSEKIERVFAREDGRLGGVQFAGGARLELDGLFIALGVMGSSALAKSMGVFTDKSGAIIVDSHGMTNIAGLYAVGDCTAGIKQVGKAVSDGVAAGMSIISDLKTAGK